MTGLNDSSSLTGYAVLCGQAYAADRAQLWAWWLLLEHGRMYLLKSVRLIQLAGCRLEPFIIHAAATSETIDLYEPQADTGPLLPQQPMLRHENWHVPKMIAHVAHLAQIKIDTA